VNNTGPVLAHNDMFTVSYVKRNYGI